MNRTLFACLILALNTTLNATQPLRISKALPFGGSREALNALPEYVSGLREGPVLHVADPCVYSDGTTYYLTGSNEQEHGFDLYCSRDLQTWDSLGVCFRMPPDHPIQTMLWASEVAAHGGRYYLTFSGWNPTSQKLEICLAVSDQPRVPFTLVAAPWIAHPTRNVIDANLFWDADGTPYIYLSENGLFFGYSGGELRMARLKRDLSGLDTELLPVCPTRQAWELHMAHPGDYCNEGAEVFRVGNTYYMLYSANETHNGYYGLGYMTAPTPLGPWVKSGKNPLMQSHHDEAPTDGSVSSPGHCGVIPKGNGRTGWLIYHQHAPWVKSYPSNDRITRLTTYRIQRGEIVIGK